MQIRRGTGHILQQQQAHIYGYFGLAIRTVDDSDHSTLEMVRLVATPTNLTIKVFV